MRPNHDNPPAKPIPSLSSNQDMSGTPASKSVRRGWYNRDLPIPDSASEEEAFVRDGTCPRKGSERRFATPSCQRLNIISSHITVICISNMAMRLFRLFYFSELFRTLLTTECPSFFPTYIGDTRGVKGRYIKMLFRTRGD